MSGGSSLPRHAPRDSVPVTPPLAGQLVVQLGQRLAASVCGTLLAQLGAQVVVVEAPVAPRPPGRAGETCGKRSIVVRHGQAEDQALLGDLLKACDVAITSSDVSPDGSFDPAPHQIACDITAFGSSGPLSGRPYSDALVQAVSGLADTTGDPDDTPTLIGFPFCEVSAGIYAAAAVVAALRVWRIQGIGQSIDIALFDCAFGALPTFLPFHVIGKPATRSGNQHSLASPWNAYRASDGWVLICTATDDQWQRLCALIGKPELSSAPGFETNAQRVSRRDEVDAVLQNWTGSLAVDRCIELLAGIGIACGPILTLEQLKTEPNLVHRGVMRSAAGPLGDDPLTLPANPLPAALPGLAPLRRVPAPDSDRDSVRRLIAERRTHPAAKAGAGATELPLQGLRVLEIGQYTTAPLVSRHLGALGAEVFKVEPPGGEGSRSWPPAQGNRGYFFAFSNSDKKSLVLDLREDHGRALFEQLLKQTDVLVENLKPGSLARLGFGVDALRRINPRLVYCGISGFGLNSAYPGRPAFDTVVQAMSGVMDLTRAKGVPTKSGISAADILGGETGLLAILAALEMRDASGRGEAIDVSMQDAAVWATSNAWGSSQQASDITLIRCADGYVCAIGSEESVLTALGGAGQEDGPVTRLSRSALVEAADRAGVRCAPVLSVSEAALSAQVEERRLIVNKTTTDGRTWPLLNCPLRLKATPPVVRTAIGELGEANNEVLEALALGAK